jgi:hypothetical protein
MTSFRFPPFMLKHHEHLTHARSLLAGMEAAPDAYLPRRAILSEWLDAFVIRASLPRYELGATEAEDLTALDDFLRSKDIAVMAAAN